MRAHVLLALTALPLLGCSGTEETSTPKPSSVDIDVSGGFAVSVHDGKRLVVSSADGRVLLDGLPPATITGEDAPPLVGFAVRDESTTYEMQFGTFKPTVNANGPWQVAERLAPSDGGVLDLQDGTGKKLARIRFEAKEKGHLVAAIEPGDGPEKHLTWGFSCDEKDHYAGFGAQSFDVDHRGFTVPTWVQEQGVGKSENDAYSGAWFLQGTRHASQAPIPQYLSSRGYILTTETNRRSIFALCSEAATEGDTPKAARIEFDLPTTVHIFDGPTPAEAIERATATFGRPRLPPRVAFAPWFDAIFGSDNVRAVAKKIRDNNIPSSVIWSEDWRGGEWSGDSYRLAEEWDLDPNLYPNAKSLSDDLHAAGFDWHVYFNPFVYKESKAWNETAHKGWLVKKTDGTPYTFTGAKFTDSGLIDLDNPDARAWAVQKMRDAIAVGADGWMNDFAEWLPTDGVTAAGPSLDRHNAYAVQWQEIAREAIDGVNDGQERLFFARSGWFGTPALVDVFWAGDQRTNFQVDDGMPTILPIGIGLGIVGVSTYGHDIGGYQSGTNSPSTKELYFRWTAVGAWSPVMRTHHGTAPKLEWAWDKDDETIAHFRRYAAWHMALVPYLEGLSQVASDKGLPMWRGLMLRFPEDVSAWKITDEVLLGDGILLAPVMTEGATSRSVYLPAGTWYPWAGGAAAKGGAMLTADAPVAEIPVYAAAGTVVPTFPDGVMTLTHGSPTVPDASSVGDDRVVYAFLGAAGSFTERGGLSYAIEHVAEASGALALSWQGKALSACDAAKTAPCVEQTANGATAHVLGPGTIEVSAGGKVVAKLTATSGKAERKLTWVIRD
ncbi:Alpha-glucosidase [Minicystis rosea]|nr:Alpha-glucosidase [Minicystis rosea]